MIKLTINSRLTNGFSEKKSKENECFWQMQEVPDQISIFKEWESVKTLIISLQPEQYITAHLMPFKQTINLILQTIYYIYYFSDRFSDYCMHTLLLGWIPGFLGFLNLANETWIWIGQIVELQKSFQTIPNSN